MKNAASKTIAEAALDSLHISYRTIDFADGTIFFSTLLNGLTFDLFMGKDGTVRLWRFVCSGMPLEQVGTHLAYQKPGYANAVIGLVVTEEGDLECYAEQKLDLSDPQVEARIQKQLEGFASIISNMDVPYVGSLLTQL